VSGAKPAGERSAAAGSWNANPMLSYCKRRWLEIEDWLRYHPRIRHSICRYELWRSRAQRVQSIVQLCAAARLADDDELERRIQERIVERVRHLDPTRLDWAELVPDFHDPRIYKAAILKPWLGPNEKGVIFISFEGQWVRLLNQNKPREFADRYTVVIAPSSSPHNFVNYVFPPAYPTPIFTLISNPHDLDVLPRVSSRLMVVPLYASHWVNPDLYQPLPKTERPYDLIMVASWGKVKRHQALFSALRTMPNDVRVVLVGQDQDGRSADTIRTLARCYGVEHRFTILSNQPYREVTKLFCQARSSVVLSKREGSCVVVAESLFADTPVGLLRGAVIGSGVFLNEQTGRFLDENELARALTDFVRNADRYQPRAWAEQNISCWRSTQILNELLKQHALERGQAWTQDLAPLQWSPDPLVARPEDRQRLAPERMEIAQRFGLEIGPPPLQ
jgi:glycosyltransferase involved in cell wall biosynthesis